MVRSRDKFVANAHGGVAVPFALALIAVVVIVGGVVDISVALNEKAKVQAAADAAALAAVNAALAHAADRPSHEGSEAVSAGRNAALSVLASNGVQAAADPVIDIKSQDAGFKATISVKAVVKTAFLGLANIDMLTPHGKSTASGGASQKYRRINIVIDNSTSMGIGSTTADQAKIEGAINCTIACHYNDHLTHEADTFWKVRKTGAVLRVDVAKIAAQRIIDEFASSSSSNSRLTEYAVYSYSNRLTRMGEPSTDKAAASNAVAAIDLVNVTNNAGTNLEYSLEQLLAETSRNGTGASPDSRKMYTVIITDGVDDNYYLVENGHYPRQTADPYFRPYARTVSVNGVNFQPPNHESCQALKSAGHTIGVLQTTYLIPRPKSDPRHSNWLFGFLSSNVLPLVAGELKRCASSEALFGNVSTPLDIVNAGMRIGKSLAGGAGGIKLTQ